MEYIKKSYEQKYYEKLVYNIFMLEVEIAIIGEEVKRFIKEENYKEIYIFEERLAELIDERNLLKNELETKFESFYDDEFLTDNTKVKLKNLKHNINL
ncbi:hypothetical protein [Peptoniphilus stercorisuis]|uniref:Uncharacterized protein n=1 Tax=Peptoniphilus stercorisuis TaxID=1436965 RepID=A0ABS4KCW3_9FIRM|nr:hypothetical protein [Peptoniphilus stercorisuis]MBP2025629.1 hypothetical protein [Peptoniphilus stercorisuis]